MAKEERIRVIEEKNIHLWFLGSPVALCSMKLELNETKNSMFAYSKMMNVQPENIKAVLFDVICYDSVHKVVDTMHKVAYYELDIPRNGVFGMDTPIRIRNNNTRTVEFVVLSVTTVSEETWENTDMTHFGIDMEQQSIINVQGDLNKDFIDNCTKANIDHTKLIFEPVFKNEYWMCACGTLNWSDENTCSGCKVTKDWLIRNTSRELLLAQSKKRISAARKIREEAQAREAQDNIAQTVEFERRKENYRLQQKEAKSKGNAKQIITATLLVILLAVAGVTVYFFGLPSARYLLAINDLNSRQYDSAIKKFGKIDGFLNSNELIKQATYEKAVSELSSGNPSEAMNLLYSILNYKDSEELYKSAAFQVGNAEFQAENYRRASEMLRLAMTSSDSSIAENAAQTNEQCIQHIYDQALSDIQSKKYEEAKESFEYLGDYKDSADKVTYCTYMLADLEYNQRNYAGAIEIYETIRGYSDVDSRLASLENLRKVTSAAGTDGSPAVWNGYGIVNEGNNSDYVFEFYLDGKYNFAVFTPSGQERNSMTGEYKIENDIIYTMYYSDGNEAWKPMSTIKSITDSSEIEGKNTQMIMTDPFNEKTTITMYGNIISDDNVSM